MDVMPVAEARAGLSRLLADFRVNDDLTVVIGAHRRPQAALLSYDRYRQLEASAPAVSLARLRELAPVIQRLAHAAHLSDVKVYGSRRPGRCDGLKRPRPARHPSHRRDALRHRPART